MSILDVLYDRYSEQELSHLISVDTSTLMRIAITAMREAEQEEKYSRDVPGKAAIQSILNQKYEVIEDSVLQDHFKDIICKYLDKILDKLAYKYKVQRKGKQFIFSESMFCIGNPESTITTKEQILAAIYAEKQKLNALNIQLARLNPQNDQYLRTAIRKQEEIIKALHTNLADTQEFNNESLSVRLKNIANSLTEEKDHKKTAASTAAFAAGGAAAGGKFGQYAIQQKAKNRWNYDKKMDIHKGKEAILNHITKDYYDAQKQKGRNNALLNRHHQLIADREKELEKITPKPKLTKTGKVAKNQPKVDTTQSDKLKKEINKLKLNREKMIAKQKATVQRYKDARNAMPMAAASVHKSKIETVDKLNKALKKVGKKGLKKGALVGAGLGLAAKALTYKPERRK